MRNLGHKLIVFVLLLIVVAPSLFSQVPSWSDAARRLARQAVVVVGPWQAARLIVRNESSLPAHIADLARDAFENELESHGIRCLNAMDASVTIKLTFSENLREYLWVAEILQADVHDVVMVALERFAAAMQELSVPSVVLRPELIWTQTEPFLDFALLGSPASRAGHLLVLEFSRLAIYQRNGAAWQLVDTQPLEPPRPGPRDPRGRIVLSETVFSVHLPGLECSGAVSAGGSAQKIGLACEKSEAWWEWSGPDGTLIGGILVAGRNFFRSLSWFQPQSGTQVPAFYSVAPVRRDGHSAWIYTGTDGVARMYSPDNRLLATFMGWGSHVAGVLSPCEGGWQIVASGSADWKATDTLQAFEVRGDQAVATTRTVELSGPVLSMKTAEDQSRVLLVVRNWSTGNYEAYALALSCSR